ncbi:MAG TPA: hypothetical protein VKB48_01635 [Candidatus Acidoferrum sp.]|nr:hypothetical protein [Candidatus Acidoferrum sp.]
MEEEHHYSSASEPERVSPSISRSAALEALKNGPRGALVIAATAVGLLLVGWLLFYFVVFLTRGAVG